MLCVIRFGLETYLIRFSSHPDSILEQFWLQNGRGFRGRKRVWKRSGPHLAFRWPAGTLLDRLLDHFGSILGAIWEQFESKKRLSSDDGGR